MRHACPRKLGVTPALLMRISMKAGVARYRHWHYSIAYDPGYLRAVCTAATASLAVGQYEHGTDQGPRGRCSRLAAIRHRPLDDSARA